MKLRYLTFTFFALLLVRCQSINQPEPKRDWAIIKDWDVNGDEQLDLNEFLEGYDQSDFFARWQVESMPISDTTFISLEFGFLDRNHDNVLDSIEYSSRRILWSFHGKMELKPWDIDGNGRIERAEFIKSARRENLAREFDLTGDGYITAREMAQAMFQICDKDGDNRLGGLEFYHWEIYRR